MFHTIPEPFLKCMRELEAQDALDREDGTPRQGRLRQIPPVTGKFLALLCANASKGGVLEVGTSGGYSSLWLALACRERGDQLTTFEILAEKVARANQTFETTGLSGQIQLIHGDARQVISGYGGVAFCFLDADNAINHAEALADFLVRAENDSRVDALVVPIGKGILVCRKG